MPDIVILGAGESGVGAALLAKKLGHSVFVSDKGQIADNYKEELNKAAIEWEESVHSEEKILTAKEVIKSPGIPENSDLIQKIRTKGIKIISEIEFASRNTKGKKIAITGTNGKTTTTTLTWHIFNKAGADAALVGNIGKSFARQVAEEDKPIYIIEVSSFQLDDMETFKPDIAILTNITPDHLDRYDYKLENYVASKFRITSQQDEQDYFVYCADDEILNQYIDLFPIKAKKVSFGKKKSPATTHSFKTNNYLSNLIKTNSVCISIN